MQSKLILIYWVILYNLLYHAIKDDKSLIVAGFFVFGKKKEFFFIKMEFLSNEWSEYFCTNSFIEIYNDFGMRL